MTEIISLEELLASPRISVPLALDNFDHVVDRARRLLLSGRRLQLRQYFPWCDEMPEPKTGLQPDWNAAGGPVRHIHQPKVAGRYFEVRLTDLERVGFSYYARDGVATQDEVLRLFGGREPAALPDGSEPRDLTWITLSGGLEFDEPRGDDCIVIRDWNSDRVEYRTIVTFEPHNAGAAPQGRS